MRFLVVNILQEGVRLDEDSEYFYDHRLIKSSVEQVISLYDVVLCSLPPDEQLVISHDGETHKERSCHAEPEHDLNFKIFLSVFILESYFRSDNGRAHACC